MIGKIGFSLASILVVFGVSGCGGGGPGGLPGPPPPPGVVVANPVMSPVQSFHEYNGYLDAVDPVEIKARVKGFLQQVHFKDGDEIKAGDKLYTIDPREYLAAIAKNKADIAKAVADTANARAQIKYSEAEYERMIKLKASVSQSEIDKALATVDSNKAQVDVALANKAAAEASLQTAELDLSYTDIRAPISGRISRTRITPGNLVGQNDLTKQTPNTPNTPLYVYFDAPVLGVFGGLFRASQAKSTQAQEIKFPVDIGVSGEEGFPHHGFIDFQENRVDPGTGTVTIRGRIPNPLVPPGNVRLLYPGLYARVRVPQGAPKDQLVLPEEALMTGQEGRFVYVVGKEDKIEKRTVSVGPTIWRAGRSATEPAWELNNPKPPAAPDESAPPGPKGPPQPTKVQVHSMVAIDQGLKADDKVVVIGLQRARPGAPVTPELWTLDPPKIPGK